MAGDVADVGREDARPEPAGRLRSLLSSPRPRAAGVALCLLASLVVALVLELSLFNLDHWTTLSNRPVTLGQVGTVTVDGMEAALYDAPADLSLIRIDAEYPTSDSQLLHAAIYASDEGDGALHLLGEARMYPGEELTCIRRLRFYGEPRQIAVAAWPGPEVDVLTAGEHPDASVESLSVTANPNVPLLFSPVRMAIVAAACCLLLATRRRGPLDVPLEERPRLAAAVCAVTTAVLVAGGAAMLVAKPIYTGVATADYNAEVYGDGGVSTFNPTSRSGERYDTDRYYELARAFLAGQVSLLEEPPSWLAEIDNPYDPALREEAVAAGGEEYLWDVAYYDGHYYVYFGVLPALVFYLPFYLLTGGTFPCGVAVLICATLCSAGIALLLWRVARAWFPRARVSTLVLVLVGCWLSSSLVTAFGRAMHYELPMAMGLGCAVWGLWALMGAMYGRGRTLPWFALSGLLLSLAFAARPQAGIAILALVPALVSLIRSGRLRPSMVACTVAPIAVVAAALMAYNFARFGSPLDFGANYNLTTNDMTQRAASLPLVLDGLFSYLLQPPSISASYPYLMPASSASDYLGLVISEPTFGGALLLYPFVTGGVLSLALPRRRRRDLGWGAGLMLAGAAVALVDTVGAGVLGRYQLDFCAFLALGASVGFLGLEASAGDGDGSRAAGRALRLCVALTVVVGVLLLLAFFSYEGGDTVGKNQFYASVWGELAAAFSLR